MNHNTNRVIQHWLDPGAALSRFKPPRDVTTDIGATEQPGQQRAWYGFRIGNFNLLISQDTSSEVLEQASIYPLPNTPYWLLGLTNLRGNLAPVFDIKKLLNLEENDHSEEDVSQEKRWVLILDQGKQPLGFYIDDLPKTVIVDQALSRLPPLPTILKPHVSKAHFSEDVVWLDFNHQTFFKTLIEQISEKKPA